MDQVRNSGRINKEELAIIASKGGWYWGDERLILIFLLYIFSSLFEVL